VGADHRRDRSLGKGRHSVGVQRQYTGSAGKLTSCQVCVRPTLATPHDHVPVEFELHLPDSRANEGLAAPGAACDGARTERGSPPPAA
jgi:SRSO17 transposase